jgi:hypothetical protein
MFHLLALRAPAKEGASMRNMILATLLGTALSAAPALAQYQQYSPYLYPAPAYGTSAVPSPTSAMVASWYQQYLLRQTDSAGLLGWVNKIMSCTSPVWVQAQILGSQEAYQKAGSTPQGFVNRAFQEVTGRQPNPGELQYWSGQVGNQGPVNTAYQMLQQFPQTAQAGMYNPPVYGPAWNGYRP